MSYVIAPLISYVTFNRLGLTVNSLSSILNTSEDFEMHIIDNNSTDGTWEYIQSLNDKRIKSKTRFPVNTGQIYALNVNLSRRRKEQYFITIDNDVVINTNNWISCFLKVFKTFPDVGMLGVRHSFCNPELFASLKPIAKNGQSYLGLNKILEDPNPDQNFLPGCCLCLRPELIELIGYWNEENGFGDIELSYRVNCFTPFKLGLMTNINITQQQRIKCLRCRYLRDCKLNRPKETCLMIYQKLYKTDVFREKFRWKFEETVKDMLSGARPVYSSSSIFYDPLSNHEFNINWATENMQFYLDNSN
jgi:glycosyltransferase involved in cell wall biosynthesis